MGPMAWIARVAAAAAWAILSSMSIIQMVVSLIYMSVMLSSSDMSMMRGRASASVNGTSSGRDWHRYLVFDWAGKLCCILLLTVEESIGKIHDCL